MAKNIALFLDGTWNDSTSCTPTNVRKLYERMSATDQRGGPQLSKYLDGVGTETYKSRKKMDWLSRSVLKQPSPYAPRFLRNLAGGVAGYGTAFRIKESYAYLSRHYVPGDSIFLFGFSRGGFAARSLAGFLDEVGLLLKTRIRYVEEAYAIYAHKDPEIRKKLSGYLRRLTGVARPGEDQLLPSHLLGVWDVVEELGLPKSIQMVKSWKTGHHIQQEIPKQVSHVRHALALHELRPMFSPLIWGEACTPGPSVRQVWFPGDHGDVGGGHKDTRLSDIALDWMAGEAHQLGLKVYVNAHLPEVAATLPIRHQIHGKFFWVKPQVRSFLRDVASQKTDALVGHRIHKAASRRLFALTAAVYPFWATSITEACLEADRCTAVLGLRLAFEWNTEPEHRFDCNPPGARELQLQSQRTGKSASEWTDVTLSQLALIPDEVWTHANNAYEILAVDDATLLRAFIFSSALGSGSFIDTCVGAVHDFPKTESGRSCARRGWERIASAMEKANELTADLDWAARFQSAGAYAAVSLALMDCTENRQGNRGKI